MLAEPMRDERGMWSTLIGDGTPLLSVTAFSLFFAGAFALFLTATEQFLPHDVQYLGMSPSELCALADCRINTFMFHDRAAFGGSLVAVAVLYLWIIAFPLRAGESWAWWTLALTGAVGFLSFLAYLGYGYLDEWHGVGTLALIPIFLAGLLRSRRLVSKPIGGSPWSAVSTRAGAGRASILATAAGMVAAGATILFIGMTSVFVPEDLAFMSVSVGELHRVNARLVSLIAHDRAGFGGGLLTTGLIVGSCAWFAAPSRALRQAFWIAGIAGFGSAIGVHVAVGYTAWTHLGPAVAGAALFILGMVLAGGSGGGSQPGEARVGPRLADPAAETTARPGARRAADPSRGRDAPSRSTTRS